MLKLLVAIKHFIFGKPTQLEIEIEQIEDALLRYGHERYDISAYLNPINSYRHDSICERYNELSEKIERATAQLKILREQQLNQEKYPLQISPTITQTSEHHYLVGKSRPYKKEE